MIACPNKSSAEYKYLVDQVGEKEAYRLFIANDNSLPNMDTIVKYANNFKNSSDLPSLEPSLIDDFKKLSEKIIIKNLDVSKQQAIVDVLYKDALLALIGKKSIKTIYDNTFKEIEDNLVSRQSLIENINTNIKIATKKKDVNSLAKLNDLLAYNERIIDLYKTYLLNKDTIIELVKNKLKADSIIDKMNLNEDGHISEDETAENEKTNDKSSYETDRIDKASRKIKRFLADIRVYNQNGTVKKNILNRDELMGYDDVYKQLQVLTKNIVPDYNVILAKLESYQETFPFLKDVVGKLKDNNTPNIDIIRNQLTTLLTNHYSNSVLVMWRDNGTNKQLTVMESNSNSIESAIREGWTNKFYESDLVQVNEDGTEIVSLETAKKLISQYDKWRANPPKEVTTEIKAWLMHFGIELDAKTWNELHKGYFKYNGKKYSWANQFKGGIFNILATQYLKTQQGRSIYEALPAEEGIVSTLAYKEGQFTTNFLSHSHREGNKTVFSYGANKDLTDITRDLHILNRVEEDGVEVFTNTLVTDILSDRFATNSSWLRDMIQKDDNGELMKASNGEYIVDQESATFSNLEFFTTSLEPLKKQGSATRDGKDFNKLSSGEQELVKIGLLQARQKDKSGNKNRIIKLLFPTIFGKTTVMGLAAKAVDIQYDYETGRITEDTIDMLYESLVVPEINRMELVNGLITRGESINLNKEYLEGSKKFLFLSELNDPKYGLFNIDGTLNSNVRTEFREVINTVIREYINQLTNEKLEVWQREGIIKDIKTNQYIDANFYNEFKKVNNDAKLTAIATDMVIQYLVGNANIYQIYIGDPALYYKKNTKETFLNVGKRLASSIAPREQFNESTTNSYKQGFIRDRKIVSSAYEQLEKLLDDEAKLKKYKEINSTDAQEYVTLLEDLYIKDKKGRIEIKGLYNKVYKIVTNELSESNYDYISVLEKSLSKEEYDYLKNIVLQPEKPIYVKNIFDKKLGIRRRVYIKSASFALSPFLTRNTELDNIRISMEKHGISRIAYDSAVKLGNVTNPLEIWNEDGTIKSEIIFDESNSILLPRSGFGIQQEVPYDPLKDSITKVSQASKNLFINMLGIDGFKVPWYKNGKSVKGRELQKQYLGFYNQLFRIQHDELVKELNYNEKTGQLDVEKLKELLKEEAVKRNYPLSDLQSLDLDTELQFLMFSPSADKFEALLNSIVTNRVLKVKFPGKSYVLGSEAGFRNVRELSETDFKDSNIVFTKNWNSKELQAADGSGRPDQIILPWDFAEDINKYIDSETNLIDTNKIPDELLQRFGMRIPNQGPNSQAKIEVVGFFRSSVGDLLIAPKEFIVRMGSDFDVDKLYIYKHTYLHTETGLKKLEMSDYDNTNIQQDINVAKENLKALIESKKGLKDIIKDKQSWVDIVEEMLGKKEWGDIAELQLLREDLSATYDDIFYYVKRLDNFKKLNNAKYGLLNNILDIHLAIHFNPSSAVQKQIHQPLGFWELENVAKDIIELRNRRDIKEGKYFTGLSDEYNKQKALESAVGKELVGIFSTDSMFNATVQGLDVRMVGNKNNPFNVTFGSRTSIGDLSSPYTLRTQKLLRKAIIEQTTMTEKDVDVKKYVDIDNINPYKFLDAKDVTFKSEVISGYQSAAVDHDKEQLVDKFNISSETSAIVKILNQLGFEKEVPYFLAQDIIIDYVNEMKRLRGIGDFVSNIDMVAYENLITSDKYKAEYDSTQHSKYGDELLTIDKMRDMIEGVPVDNYKLTQIAILDKYIALKPKGRTIGKVQSLLNLDSQGLGKSFISTLLRENDLDELKVNIANIDSLISEKTIQGLVIKSGLKLNNSLWSKFFKYDRVTLEENFRLLESIFNKVDANRETKADFRKKMWNKMKEYRFTDPNLFSKEPITDPNYLDNERKRLLISTKENKSLAKVLQEIKRNFPNNRFLNNLDIVIKKNNLPSIIKFRASVKENTNETKLYEAIVDLLVNEKNLGPNGEVYSVYGKDNYTSRDLFQDLVWSAYLNGGVQQASQYIKYIPAAYLHLLPFVKNITNWINDIHEDNRFSINETDAGYIVSDAVLQIVQNDPDSLPKVSENSFIKNNDEFLYKGTDVPLFFSQYIQDKAIIQVGLKRFKLYQYAGRDGEYKGKYYPVYVEIPTVGTSGRDKVSEYNYLRKGLTTSIFGNKNQIADDRTKSNTSVKPVADVATKPKEVVNNEKSSQSSFEVLNIQDSYKPELTGKSVSINVLNKIFNNSTDPFNKIVSKLILDKIESLNLDKFDIKPVSKLLTNWGIEAAGKSTTFPSGKRLIELNTNITSHKQVDKLEHTFLHEFIHLITQDAIKHPKNDEQRKIVKNLGSLRDEITKYINSNPKLKDKYDVFKVDRKLTSDKDTYVFYALQDNVEFTALMLSNQYVQEFASNITVQDKNIFEKFIENIIDILNSLGFDVKKDSVAESALDSIIKLIDTNIIAKSIVLPNQSAAKQTTVNPIDNNNSDDVDDFNDMEDADIDQAPMDDDPAPFLPDFIPSVNDILKEFKELDNNGNSKKLIRTQDNYEIMRKRAAAINQGQRYYKATVGLTNGENVSSKSTEFWKIQLTPKEDLSSISYLVDIVPNDLLENVMKQCK